MKIVKNGKEHWLTTLDIAFLTLFTLQMLMEECWRKRVLLVGVTKDTAARALKTKISLEKAFVKTYVQLSQAKSDPLLRSNVLLIDRLAYPEYDCEPESAVKFWNELSDGSRERVESVLYVDRTV